MAAAPQNTRPTVHGLDGTTVTTTSTGAPSAATAFGCSLLLHPATELEDGVAGLWLRRRDVGSECWEPQALVGTASGTGPVLAQEGGMGRSGAAVDLSWAWRLTALTDRPGWAWDVVVTHHGQTPVQVDLVHAQDLALSDPAVLDANRRYPSQYLDLSPVALGDPEKPDDPDHPADAGTAVAVRQNMPGPAAPWALLRARTPAHRWATDLLQLTGRGLPEGAPWPGLSQDLPAARLQHEHALAVLQTAPVTLAPGESWRSGFAVVLQADHPGATSDADAAAARGIPWTDLPEPDGRPDGPPVGPVSLLGRDAAYLPVRELTDDELTGLVPGQRHHVEERDGRAVSWFTADGDHLVTAAKQSAVLRPHGQILRPLHALVPASADVTSTVWMDGSFCSHLTQGHAAAGRILSPRQTPLGVGRVHGLRVAVDLGPGWQLLGTPSAWLSGLDRATWWYAVQDRLLRVVATGPGPEGRCTVELTSLAGEPVPALLTLAMAWPGSGSVGPVERHGDTVRVTRPDDSRTAQSGGSGHLEVGLPTGAQVGDDSALFADGAGRGEPVITVLLPARRSWGLTLTPRTTPAQADDVDEMDATRQAPEVDQDPRRSGQVGGGWAEAHDRIRLASPRAGGAADLLDRVGSMTGWYAHDALVHYLSPRGLEQHTGGAWGTRDVCQGPVGLLRSWAAHDDWRSLLLLVLRGQHERGDWPQAFDFLDGHRRDVVADAHGDVVYWPLLALGQYLLATGDHGILQEEVAFTGDGSPAGTASVAEHVERALAAIERTFVAGTALPAYGHGDWNDSLQPADPALARRLVSTWTVVLQAEALGRLAEATATAYPALSARAAATARAGAEDLRRHLLIDAVLAGYGVVGDDGTVRPLIHPRDDTTGLTYSLLPMIHAICGDLLEPDEARRHLEVIEDHLLGPDGARLFDQPVAYRGGPIEIFQRAEASSFFGREIGIMYVHAHLRYAEALARVGDGAGLLRALAQAVPVDLEELVPSAAPRQANTYSSSSDAAFADRYQAARRYAEVRAGQVPLEAGWRVYSSGPGLFLEMVTQRLLGVRHAADRVEVDPVLDPALGEVTATLPVRGRPLRLEVITGPLGHGVRSVLVDDVVVDTEPLVNPYRPAGVTVRTLALTGARTLQVLTG